MPKRTLTISCLFLFAWSWNSGLAQNVGIGNSTPQDRLDVTGKVRSTGVRITGNNSLDLGFDVPDKEINAGRIGYGLFTPNTVDIVGGGTSSIDRRIRFWAEAGAQFEGGATFLNQLRVNYGGPNPGLIVQGGVGNVTATEGDLRIGTDANRLKMGVFTTGGSAGQARIISAGTNARLTLGLNAQDIIGILPNNNGTVVIGNGTGVSQFATGYKLNVQGKIVCTELMVKSVAAWPDYVFDPLYRLMPVDELEQFISKNHHLPGFLPASQMEALGQPVGEVQRLQLQKIEELTLYIIQLQKEVNQLKQALTDNSAGTKAQ